MDRCEDRVAGGEGVCLIRNAFVAANALPARLLRSGARITIVQPKDVETTMTQTQGRFFDEIGRLMNDAAGVAQGVRREIETVVKAQAERFLRDLDVVKREEFEAVKEMAQLAREENEALKARIAALEAKLAR